ncbi:hypothetical protein C5167_007140, partial [Papaver somniferum]
MTFYVELMYKSLLNFARAREAGEINKSLPTLGLDGLISLQGVRTAGGLMKRLSGAENSQSEVGMKLIPRTEMKPGYQQEVAVEMEKKTEE